MRTEAKFCVCLPAGLLEREGGRWLHLQGVTVSVFDELRTPVFRYLRCMGTDTDDADEIIQETFLKLYEHLHAGGQDSNLRGWIFRVAHNLAINRHKARKYLTPVDLEQWETLGRLRADPNPNPEQRVLQQEKMRTLHMAFATLSTQQRHCVHMRAEGLRYREIADCLGVSISTVVESLRRGVAKLIDKCNV